MNERTRTRLVLVRHGESKVTVRRVIGGHRCCDGLSDLGRRQAERLATRLAETGEIPADRLVSSHYRRAIETAETLAATLQLAVEIDAGFGEHDPGPELDGMPFAEFVDRFGVPDWNGDPHAEIFPGGETTAEFHVRVGAALAARGCEHRADSARFLPWRRRRCSVPPDPQDTSNRRVRAAHPKRIDHRIRHHIGRSMAVVAVQRRRAPCGSARRNGADNIGELKVAGVGRWMA